MLTKGAIGNLINRYKAVLKKCNLINTFGSLAVASMLVMGGAGVAEAGYFEGKGQQGYVVDQNTTDPKTPDLGDRVVGGWFINKDDSNATIEDAQKEINASVTVSDVQFDNNGGTTGIIFGSHYISGLGDLNTNEVTKEDALKFNTGKTSVTITDSQVEFVVAGTGMYNSNVIFEGDSTDLTINSGTFGLATPDTNVPEQLIVGGDFLKQGHDDTSNAGVTTGYATSTLKNTNVTINDGTFNSAVMGGSAVVEFYRSSKGTMSAEVTDTATLNINGGTFNQPIAGGGMSYGGPDSFTDANYKDWYKGVSSHVEKAIINIDGSSNKLHINSNIYAGGIQGNMSALPDYDWNKNTVGSTAINISNATVQNVYGTNVGMYGNHLANDVMQRWESINYVTLNGTDGNADKPVKTTLTLENVDAQEVYLKGEGSKLIVKGADATVDSKIKAYTGDADIEVKVGAHDCRVFRVRLVKR